MNFMQLLEKETQIGKTNNGAIVYNTSGENAVDFFATVGAMRNWDADAKVKSFAKAYLENAELAMKTLFYSRDIRGGMGERKTFRDIFSWIVKNNPQLAIQNIPNVVEMGRWDDLIYTMENDEYSEAVVKAIKKQLVSDMTSDAPSLLAKWLPSINASSSDTNRRGRDLAKKLGITHREYRKTLSKLRAMIDVVEVKMSSNKFDNIIYKNVPSNASMIYRNAFYKHDSERYEDFIEKVKSGEVKIKAGTLFPYDIVRSYDINLGGWSKPKFNETLEQQWKALPNYMDRPLNALVVADTSGSMNGLPMDISLSLAVYIAERNTSEVYKDKFITFSSKPSFHHLKGDTLFEKLSGIESIVDNTNVEAVFDLVLNTAINNNVNRIPEQLLFISDMQFDSMTDQRSDRTFMKSIKRKYENAGYKLPNLIFWNVNATGDSFPMQKDEHGIIYVSGASPAILKSVLNNNFLSPLDTVKDTVLTDRYSNIVYHYAKR